MLRSMWMQYTAPEKPCETSNIEYKMNHLKGQCLSIASIIFIISFSLFGVIERLIPQGIACSLSVLFSLFLLNRKGYVKATAIYIAILTQAVAFFMLIINHETTGITVLLMSTIICVLALPSLYVVVFMLLTILTMMLYMFDMHQLLSNLMWTRLVTHIGIGLIEYVACRLVNWILVKANDLQNVVNEQKSLERKNELLEEEKDQLVRSLFLVRRGLSQFENGDISSRIEISDKNSLKDVSTIMNILLSKQEKLYQKNKEHEMVEKYITDISAMLHMSEAFKTQFYHSYTRTPVDRLIQVLQGKKVVKP